MKKLVVLSLSLTLLAAFAVSNAQPPQGDRPDGPPPPGGARPDGNRRGPGGPGGPGRGGMHPEGHRPPPFMEALDKNRDHFIDEEELNAAKASLMKLDKNGDGKLSPQELMGEPPHRRGPGGPGGRPGGMGPGGERDQRPGGKKSPILQRLLKLDKDGDGKLSKSEVPEKLQERFFKNADTNSDDVIDEEEMKALEQKLLNRNSSKRPKPNDSNKGSKKKRPEPKETEL